MTPLRFVAESVLPASRQAVFAFHEAPDAFARLLAPWERVRDVQGPTSLQVGTLVRLQMRIGPLWVTIVSEHVAYEPGVLFVDEMRRGPFRSFRHRHLFLDDPAGCRLRDEIEYVPPLGLLGRLADPIAIRPRLRRLFAYRHAVTAAAVEGVR